MGTEMKKFIQEFKAFATKGNVVDMAVGVIVGGAFSKIVTSLVNDLIMPLFSLITGRVNLAALSLTINNSIEGADPIVIKYGAFMQNVLDFFLIALTIFFVIKAIGKLRRKKEEAPAPAPAPVPEPTKEEVLLTEIRDLLKSRKEGE